MKCIIFWIVLILWLFSGTFGMLDLRLRHYKNITIEYCLLLIIATPFGGFLLGLDLLDKYGDITIYKKGQP